MRPWIIKLRPISHLPMHRWRWNLAWRRLFLAEIRPSPSLLQHLATVGQTSISWRWWNRVTMPYCRSIWPCYTLSWTLCVINKQLRTLTAQHLNKSAVVDRCYQQQADQCRLQACILMMPFITPVRLYRLLYKPTIKIKQWARFWSLTSR